MNTRSLLLLLVLCLSVSLVACGDQSGDADTGETPSPDAGEPDTEEPNAGEPESEEPEAQEPCEYPSNAPSVVTYEAVMPNFSWEGVYRGDGSQVDFSMEEFHCSPEYEKYNSLVFMISTAWCVYCPDYIRYLDSIAESLEEKGMLIVYSEVQNDDFSPSFHTDAQAHINGLVGEGRPGLRLGDAQTNPMVEGLSRNELVPGFPSAYVVRREDMIVSASQHVSNSTLPFEGIADDPTGDWTMFEPPFTQNCDDTQEESFEPNDTPDTAGLLELDKPIEGGICSPAPDYYRIEEEGWWQLDLEFIHSVGDLDVQVWDNETGEAIFASASETDNETLIWEGPATILVVGFNFASSTYTMTLSPSEGICPDGDDPYEEAGNNEAASAPSIEPGTFSGGICGLEQDFFKVDLEGSWTLDLEFTHNNGDLDVYIWDTEMNQPVIVDEAPVGSESTNDNESFEYEGPATIAVLGFRGARNTYTLTLTDNDAPEDPPAPECTEEALEADGNNDASAAPALEVGAVEGGVCDAEPDFYQVSLEGAWRLDLAFTHENGDLNAYVWDAETNAPLMVEEAIVGSESTDDNESFEHEGPAIIAITGLEGAQNNYSLTLTDLTAE